LSEVCILWIMEKFVEEIKVRVRGGEVENENVEN
jgi:hypothetical protein